MMQHALKVVYVSVLYVQEPRDTCTQCVFLRHLVAVTAGSEGMPRYPNHGQLL